MTLTLTNLDSPHKQIKNYILKERVKNHSIDSICLVKGGRLSAAVFFYDDRSVGVHVKSKLSFSEIKFMIKEFKKKMLTTEGEWFCMCKKNVKSGNKLAQLCGFRYKDKLNGYNIYVW